MAPRLLVPRPVRFGLAAVVLVWVGCGQDPPVPDPIPPTYIDFLQVPEGWTLPEFPEATGPIGWPSDARSSLTRCRSMVGELRHLPHSERAFGARAGHARRPWRRGAS